MPDPVVHITAGIPDSGTGNITTLGQTLLDGANLTLGAIADVAATGAGTVNAHLRSIATNISSGISVSGTITANQGGAPWTVKPDGTAWTLTGTSANVNVTNGSIAVTGTFFQATQPISAVSLPLPSGAATSAKQPALGTAGTASTDVITVQGIASMTALKVDGSAVTQPVSGTVTVQQATAANLNATVTGTIAATQSGTWNVTNISGTVSLPTGAATSANQPTNAAQGSTTSGQTGTLVQGAVTTASPAYTTGQTSPLSLDTSGNLRVNVVAGGASGGTSSTFGAAFPGTGTAIGVMNSAATAMTNLKANASNALVVDGSAVTQPISGTITANQGGTWTVQPGNTANTTAWLVTGTGGTFPVTGTVSVSGSVTVTGAVTGSSATAPVSTMNSASANSGTTAAMSAVFDDVAPTAITENNFGYIRMSANRNQYTTIRDAAGNERGVNVSAGNALLVDGTATTQPVSIAAAVTVAQPTAANLNATVTGTITANQGGTWTVQQGTPPWSVGGDVASGSADSGNPVKMGAVARTANPTAVTTGQRVNLMADKLGKLVAVGALRDLKGKQKTSISVATETTVVTAGAAGVFNDVYAIVVTNKSATAVFVDFRDSTAGTIQMTLAAPANDTRGFTVPVDSAMVQTAAANNWTATVSSAVSSIEITMLFVSNT